MYFQFQFKNNLQSSFNKFPAFHTLNRYLKKYAKITFKENDKFIKHFLFMFKAY